MEGKNIKVYGTLINHTLNTDASMRDSQHNDLVAVAYQLFDERFSPKKGSGTNGAVINIDRYQDIINKRLTALFYDPNGDLTSLYSNLYVSGNTNIGGDLTVEGDVNITGDVNLNIGLNDLNDVTLSTMAVGQVLRYDGSKWVNTKLSLNDILMPAASNGLVLKFNGTEWVAGEDISEQGSLSSIEIVTVTGQWIRSSQSEHYSAFYAMQESDTNSIINAYVTITYEGDIRKLDVLWRSKYSDFGNQSGYYTPNYPDSVADVTIAPKFQFFKVRQ